jgi:hypothetical protein
MKKTKKSNASRRLYKYLLSNFGECRFSADRYQACRRDAANRIARLVQLFINTKNKPLKPTIMKTNYEKQATLRIKSEVNGEMKHFDIENFDVVKANQLYDHKYSLAIYEEIKKGLSNLFGYEIYSLPVCNISESDFKSDQKFRMAGGYADCLGEGNMNNHQVFFDAELI